MFQRAITAEHPGGGRYHGGTLGAPELQHYLGVFTVEWRLDRELLRMVKVAERGDLLVDADEFVVCGCDAPEVAGRTNEFDY